MRPSGLKQQQRVLQRLAEGPATKVDLTKALGWSLYGQSKHLDVLLRKLREDGLIEAKRSKRVTWQLASNVRLCECCGGQGVIRDGQ